MGEQFTNNASCVICSKGSGQRSMATATTLLKEAVGLTLLAGTCRIQFLRDEGRSIAQQAQLLLSHIERQKVRSYLLLPSASVTCLK